MCGICGIVIPDSSSRSIDDSAFTRLRDTLAHRGPDGFGTFIEPGVALGHRRLSIVDVSHGQQPMTSADDALVLVYNGEVFNHPTLMAQLQQDGVRYRTHCDTETVLHVFERRGEAAPEELRGMFAYAVWDKRTRTLTLARDRFGVKPLYYALLPDGTLVFGSEMKAIVASGLVRASLREDALPDYLANHATSGEGTLLAGIKRLLPGHTLVWRDGEIRTRRYWDLRFEAKAEDTRSDAELITEYRERLREAVRLRLMADVPLGAFLSGGIDSATITALMSQLVDEPIKTFSVGFAEREANELSYARIVAKAYKTDHHEVVVTPEQFFGALPTLVWHEDEPLAHPSSVALNFVSRLAAERVKVVLTGEGSDETLAGYGRYKKTILNMRLGGAYQSATPAPLRSLVRSGLEALPASRTRQRALRTFLARPATLEALYLDNFAVFSREQQAGLLAPTLRARLASEDPYATAMALMAGSDARSLLDRLLYVDTKTYLHELLMKQDQMSMAASIESRVPFLDHPLVEWTATLPERLKLRGGTTKFILREAMRDVLPPEILSRGKMGFPVPIGSWLRGPYRAVVDELVLSPRALERRLFDPESIRALVRRHQAGEDHAERLWSLVNLEIWHRVVVEGEPAESLRLL
ncbi:MAG: asparagine synthase (glutamine-hydrolyzing) [Gemmatimonadetes bacterium]|nr:MAG: asparagine synthase (glutamine-hydrolyzing) [Gemmatimonadota bacterium]